MEELGFIWGYQEFSDALGAGFSPELRNHPFSGGELYTFTNVDELKEELLCRTLELESLKMAATEEIRKAEENLKSMLELLKMACNERDEARTQLQILMERLLFSDIDQFQTRLPRSLSENPMCVHVKANSSITESNSLSTTSPAVSSPEFSNIIDPSSEIIENIAKGKPLPQKGKLLQAVMAAGPLLQTLLVAGALPRWRNPPPSEPFPAPPSSIKGSQSLNFDQNPPPKSSFSARKQQISSSYSEIFRGPSRMCSRTPPSSYFDIPDGKRQRLQ